MAIDHFEKHARKSPVDWNFNLLFDSQPEVAALADHYAPALAHPGLHEPIPAEWLHATILRVGLLEEYTEQEMLAVADALQPKLSLLTLPNFQFDSWWIWDGTVVLHLSPSDEFAPLYNAVQASLLDVVGEKRSVKTPYGHFIPHTTLAYARTHDAPAEKEIYDKLMATPAKPTSFQATNVSLIKQWPTNGHYEWEIVRRIPLRGASPDLS